VGTPEHKSAAEHRSFKKLVSQKEVQEKVQTSDEMDGFLAIRVTAEKIRHAVGKRKEVTSQLAVMGASATKVSYMPWVS
jgi:hypothetical protein